MRTASSSSGAASSRKAKATPESEGDVGGALATREGGGDMDSTDDEDILEEAVG